MKRSACYLFSLIVLSTITFAAVPNDPGMVIPIEVNAKAPAFDAREVDGRTFHFNPAALKKPTMLIFYRGGWCPYCNAQLQDLHEVEPQVHAMGYDVIFLSTDQPKLLYSSLKQKVDYHLLSESDMQAAHAFGVAFHVDTAGVEKLKSYGVDLDATQGNDRHELPVPSVFIVDTHGIVRFRHFDPDFKVRLDAAHVLSAAKEVIASSH